MEASLELLNLFRSPVSAGHAEPALQIDRVERLGEEVVDPASIASSTPPPAPGRQHDE